MTHTHTHTHTHTSKQPLPAVFQFQCVHMILCTVPSHSMLMIEAILLNREFSMRYLNYSNVSMWQVFICSEKVVLSQNDKVFASNFDKKSHSNIQFDKKLVSVPQIRKTCQFDKFLFKCEEIFKSFWKGILIKIWQDSTSNFDKK